MVIIEAQRNLTAFLGCFPSMLEQVPCSNQASRVEEEGDGAPRRPGKEDERRQHAENEVHEVQPREKKRGCWRDVCQGKQQEVVRHIGHAGEKKASPYDLGAP